MTHRNNNKHSYGPSGFAAYIHQNSHVGWHVALRELQTIIGNPSQSSTWKPISITLLEIGCFENTSSNWLSWASQDIDPNPPINPSDTV